MSLFNKPSWAKSQVDDSDAADTDLFNHSSRSYREIIAEQERKKQENIERQKAKEQRRSSGKHRVKEEPRGESSVKRRRISVEDDEARPDENTKRSSLDVEQVDDGNDLDNIRFEPTPVRRSPRKNTMLKAVSKPIVLELGESDNDDSYVIETAPVPQAKPEVVKDESDDEFAELARRARQQRQRKEEQAKNSQPADTTTHTQTATTAVSSDQGKFSTLDEPDPTISIFITSRIPNTTPLIVQRKLSQRLQEIRQVWCMKQGFTAEATKDVFFIHRMHRVYDVTKCRSLGLDVDAFGNVTMKGVEGLQDVDKIHLEAVTNELFDEIKAEKGRERNRRSTGDHTEDSAEDGATEETEQPKEESVIRLTLKAKGKEDFKLRVKPITLVSKIIAAYCKSQSTGSRPIFLEFDGERLDPEMAVQDTDIDDLDCIDVHIA